MAGQERDERWMLFNHDELEWLALGLSVAEGEGLLPPTGDAKEFAAFTSFQESLDAAAEAGR